MDFIPRHLEPKLRYFADKFPFVTLTGPRQSGKSTLVRMAFPDYEIVSLEDLDLRLFAAEDPRGFINTYPRRVIIDEFQRVPSLLSYLQTHADRQNVEGQYILTGSQSATIMSAVDQSLAGRTALLSLLPLSVSELKGAGIAPASVDAQIFDGGYPRVYAKEIPPTDYYPSYINTYVERDLRQLLDVFNLDKFVRFMKLCAARIGQLLNKSSLAVETGVTVPTVDSWLSVLEASYIVYLLKPYHENFSKRLVKSPKLYFYDTGVACSFLELADAAQVNTHYLRGALFENLVINELIKSHSNAGRRPSLWFWRDSSGNEVDVVDTTLGSPKLYEIKSGATFNHDYFRGTRLLSKKLSIDADHCHLIYNGEQRLMTAEGEVTPWNAFLQI